MPVLLERAFAVRSAIVALSCLAVLGLAHAALAEDDLGLRGIRFWPEQFFGASASPAPAPLTAPVGTAVPHRHARRIWAAAKARPLRITLDRNRRRARLAARRRVAPRLAAVSRPARNAAPRFAILPKPERPALVAILQDRTLRDGDAVMTGDGIRLFRGGASWPHRRTDFVPLQFVTRLGWSLRHTLSDIDQAPPSRWTLAERPVG